MVSSGGKYDYYVVDQLALTSYELACTWILHLYVSGQLGIIISGQWSVGVNYQRSVVSGQWE